MIKVHLQDADLNSAHLEGADLFLTQLSGADLSSAYLEGAELNQTRVDKARLDHADLTNAVYAPASEAPDPYVAGIKGLATIEALIGDVVGLVQLQKLLKDAGLSDNEREVTKLNTT
jgi:hypothetical protein